MSSRPARAAWDARLLLPGYAATLFIGACLLFLVQPMISKMILPQLGGSPSVWNTCMCFFQAVLLLGYAYAHWLTTRLAGARRPASTPRCLRRRRCSSPST